MTKRYGPPTPADMVASMLMARRIKADPLRLQERVEAVRSRQKIEDKADLEHTRSLGTAVRKARRDVELAQWAWRREPTAERLSEVGAAKWALREAQDELLDAVAQDQDLASRLSRG